jgi:hypothetical protein
LVAVDTGVDSEAFLFTAFMAAVGIAGAAVLGVASGIRCKRDGRGSGSW